MLTYYDRYERGPKSSDFGLYMSQLYIYNGGHNDHITNRISNAILVSGVNTGQANRKRKYDDIKDDLWLQFARWVGESKQHGFAIASDAYRGERHHMTTWGGKVEMDGYDPLRLSTWNFFAYPPERWKKYVRKLPNRVNPNSNHLISVFIIDLEGIANEIGS